MLTGSEDIGLEEVEKLRGSAEFSFRSQELQLEIEFPAEKLKKSVIAKTNGRRNKNNLF